LYSELAGLRCEDLREESITIDERFCCGDWGAPKSESSNAPVGVNRCVLELAVPCIRASVVCQRLLNVVARDGVELNEVLITL
jgi:hypothetical protein